MARKNGETKEDSVVVAIEKDKGSQYALKWTVDHLLKRGQTLTLLHIKQRPSSSIPSSYGNQGSINEINDEGAKTYGKQVDGQARDLFLPFRFFCIRKEIQCIEVCVEETDIAKGIIDYVTVNRIEILILGSPSKGGLVRRFMTTDVPSIVSKGTPDFCTVYVINKGKIASVRSASGPPPPPPPSTIPPVLQNKANSYSDTIESPFRPGQ